MTKLTQILLDKINFKKHGTGKCLTLCQATLFSKSAAVIFDPTEATLRIRLGDTRINLDALYRRQLRISSAYRAFRSDIKLRIQYFNAPVYIYFWSRDCDCVEGDDIVAYKNLREAKKGIANFYANAEGSGYHEFSTKDAYDVFEGSYRDRVADAFDNGHNYTV